LRSQSKNMEEKESETEKKHFKKLGGVISRGKSGKKNRQEKSEANPF